MLCVRGHQLAAVRDDKLAQWIHAEKHLQPWMGHEGLLVDRYDARLLLENEGDIKKLKAFALQTPPDEDGELQQQLAAERYRDLHRTDGGTIAKQTKPSSESIRTCTAVGFKYDKSLAQAQPSEQDQEVMRRTASFVCSQPDGVCRAIDVLKFKNIHNRSVQEPICISHNFLHHVCCRAAVVPAKCRSLNALDSTFDFLLHDDPRHSVFRSYVDEEQAKRKSQQLGSDDNTANTLPGLAAYGDSDTSDSDSTAEDTTASLAGCSDATMVGSLGSPITAATLTQVKLPKEVVLPDDPTVLAMLAKLLEFRRTFTGSSWPGFLAQLQQQESVRPGPNRFTFLLRNSPHYDFWLWAVKAAKASV
eukprot:COSAG02_NODE_769_length_17369_cov_8.151013_3_plen_361_part_00